MSSSMETALLMSDTEPGPKNWREVDMRKWQDRLDAKPCPAQSAGGHCFISDEPCAYDICFGRYWGVM